MDRYVWKIACLLVALLGTTAAAQKIKIIVDQDARGPGTSDQQAILVFLQSDKFDVLGITTVSGDQSVKEETQHALRVTEIAERTDASEGRTTVQTCNLHGGRFENAPGSKGLPPVF